MTPAERIREEMKTMSPMQQELVKVFVRVLMKCNEVGIMPPHVPEEGGPRK